MTEFFNWLDTAPLWQFLLLMAAVFFAMMIITIIGYRVAGMSRKPRRKPPFIDVDLNDDEVGYW